MESPKPSIGRSTNTKRVIASFAVELTEEENGSLWITATTPAKSGAYYARHVTDTSSAICVMNRLLLNVAQTISEIPPHKTLSG